MKYTPIILKLNISNPLELPAVDSIPLGHFWDGSEVSNSIKWFDRIQELMKLNEQLVSERSASIQIVKHGTAWWVCVTFVVLMIIAIGCLVAYNVYLNQDSTKHHRSIARDLTELKSNYCEVKIDCENCNNQNIKKKEKSRIEVGRDESITINLNRPLPSPLVRDGSI